MPFFNLYKMQLITSTMLALHIKPRFAIERWGRFSKNIVSFLYKTKYHFLAKGN